ncbi:hypothetical protein AHAS_Ahas05G0145900 [Arachis hypogaea]
MTRSLPDPSLAIFDPKIERTLSCIRQARRRLASEGGEVVTTNSLVLSEDKSEASFKEETSSSSTDSVDLRTDNMAALHRVTLQEAGAPNFTLPPFQARHPNLGADIELKTTLINLLQSSMAYLLKSPSSTSEIDEGKMIPHKLTGKCTGSHQVVITHKSEVDPTGIDGLSNFS